MYTHKSKAVRLKEAILGIRCCCFFIHNIKKNNFFSFASSLSKNIGCVCIKESGERKKYTQCERKKNQRADLYFYFEKGWTFLIQWYWFHYVFMCAKLFFFRRFVGLIKKNEQRGKIPTVDGREWKWDIARATKGQRDRERIVYKDEPRRKNPCTSTSRLHT